MSNANPTRTPRVKRPSHGESLPKTKKQRTVSQHSLEAVAAPGDAMRTVRHCARRISLVAPRRWACLRAWHQRNLAISAPRGSLR